MKAVSPSSYRALRLAAATSTLWCGILVSTVALAAAPSSSKTPGQAAAPPTDSATNLDSEPPGAKVLVDGRMVCAATPCSVELRGKHMISMVAPDYATRTESVQVTPGDLIRWVLPKAFGTVFVESRPPNVAIHVDGKPAGNTPVTVRLTPGQHKISIASECFGRLVRDVDVAAGSHTSFGFDPKPRTRTVKVTAEDAAGQPVRANVVAATGRILGATPAKLSLPVCLDAVTLRHPDLGEREVRVSGSAIRGVLSGGVTRLLRLDGHVLESFGSDNPRVLVTIINEFNCNSCKAAERIASQLRRVPDVHVTVIHNPSFRYAHARPAAELAVAAGFQGGFWPAFTKFHANYSRLSPQDLARYRTEFGLDGLLSDPAVRQRASDIATFHRRIAYGLIGGSRATPVVFVNGQRHDYARSVSNIQSTLNKEMNAVPQGGWANVRARIADRGPKLYGYLFEGVEPPPAPKRPKPRFDAVVWHVPVQPADATRGPSKAPLTIVRFKNYYYCRQCREHDALLDKAIATYGTKVRVVEKYSQAPYYARTASIGAKHTVCAYQQGKGIAFERVLVEKMKGRQPSMRHLQASARKVQLDSKRLATCLADKRLDKQLDVDAQAGIMAKVGNGSVLFVNGRKVGKTRQWEDFKFLLDEELAHGIKVAKARRRANPYEAMIKAGRQQLVFSTPRVKHAGRRALRIGKARASTEITLWVSFRNRTISRAWKGFEAFRKANPRTSIVIKTLPQSLRDGRLPAESLYCAQAQRNTAAMFRVLMGWGRVRSQDIHKIAARAGLKPKPFQACMKSRKMQQRVDADIAEARRLNVRLTPTVFVNGYRLHPVAISRADPNLLRRYLTLAKAQSKRAP